MKSSMELKQLNGRERERFPESLFHSLKKKKKKKINKPNSDWGFRITEVDKPHLLQFSTKTDQSIHKLSSPL